MSQHYVVNHLERKVGKNMSNVLIERPNLKLMRSDKGEFISPCKKRIGTVLPKPRVEGSVLTPQLAIKAPVKELNVVEFKRKVGHQRIKLRDVRGEQVDVEYKLFTYLSTCPTINWDKPLPNIPLRLEIVVGRAKILIDMPTEYLERTYSDNGVKEQAHFRRASDLRGYNDTYILQNWTCSEVCFYLRSEALGPIVDDDSVQVIVPKKKPSESQEGGKYEESEGEPEEEVKYLDVKTAVVYQHQVLNKERFSKIGGHLYLSKDPDTKRKLSFIKNVAKYIPII